MPEPIVSLTAIHTHARRAASEGAMLGDCPHPPESAAAQHWTQIFEAAVKAQNEEQRMQARTELTINEGTGGARMALRKMVKRAVMRLHLHGWLSATTTAKLFLRLNLASA